MNIAICATTYNRKDLVAEWINGLMTNFPPKASLYIADNNSTDGTKEFIQQIQKDPRITVIFHDKNIGKAKAMNELFTLAVKKNINYLVSSDSDIVVGQGWWNYLLSIYKDFEGIKKIGWVAPIYYDDNSPIPHSRKEVYELGKGKNGDGDSRNGFIDDISCAGGFFMMPIEMYKQVGGYVIDNVYGGIDGSYLHVCRKAGYRCGYTVKCIVRHLCGTKYEEYEKWKRNIQRNLKKHGVFNYKVKKGFWDK